MDASRCAYCRSHEGLVAMLLVVGGLGWALALIALVLMCVQKGVLE